MQMYARTRTTALGADEDIYSSLMGAPAPPSTPPRSAHAFGPPDPCQSLSEICN